MGWSNQWTEWKWLRGPVEFIRVIKSALQAQRKEAVLPVRARHEYGFLPAYLEVLEKPPNPFSRYLAFGICAVLVLVLAWSMIGEMDIIASTQGKLIVSSRSKVVQSLEAGQIKAIHVRDGQYIKAGEPLVELNPTSTDADHHRLRHLVQISSLDRQRLLALLSSDPLTDFQVPQPLREQLSDTEFRQARELLESQYFEYQSNLKTLDSELAQTQAQLASTAAEIESRDEIYRNVLGRVEVLRGLESKNAIPKIQVITLEEDLLTESSHLTVLRSRLVELQAKVEYTRSRRTELQEQKRREWREQLHEVNRQLAELTQELVKAEERTRSQFLRAPVSGVVQQLAVHTLGGVVTPAQELMVIVPDSATLEAEILILNKDVGFVLPGQAVEVKVESFPYTKYGTLPGKILHVSRDAVENQQLGLVFPARVELARASIVVGDTPVNLSAGMGITAEIQTGSRRMIDYLISPLREYQSEALRER